MNWQVFPKTCVGCGRIGHNVCEYCLRFELHHYFTQTCHVCRQPVRQELVHVECAKLSWLDGVVVVAEYTGLWRQCITGFKYEFKYELANDLARPLASAISRLALPPGVIVCPVPSTRRRRWWRGFDHIGLLAERAAAKCGLPLQRLLYRGGRHAPQMGKSRAARLQIRSVQPFCVAESLPLTVLLIDDVMTTGATLEACAKLLKRGGVQRVWAATLAREA